MPTIDYAYVSGLREHLTTSWSLAHAQWQQWHDFHDQRHMIRYAKPADVRKLGIARAKISAMVDTLVTDEPVVTREVVAEGENHRVLADEAENWAKALLIHAATASGAIPPFRTAATYLALLGYAAGVVRWDDKLWDARASVKHGPGYKKRLEEAKKQQAKVFPYVIEFPHPARILLPHQERRPSCGIELASMYAWQVEEMLLSEGLDAKVSELHGDNPYSAYEVLNYWDEKKKGLFIDGVDVEVRDNGLGAVPFVHGFSGYGHEGMPQIRGEASTTGGGVLNMGPHPEDLAIGLLAGVIGSIMALDEVTTALNYLVQRASYPTYFTKENAEDLARKMEQAGLGGIVEVSDPANALKPSDIPQMGQWVYEHKNDLRRDIDEGTFMGVVAGEMSPNVKTATGTAIQLGQARLKFGEPMRQLNLMAGEMVGLCAKMTALRGEKVTIDGYACGSDEFEENYYFKVDFMAKDEGQLLRDKNSGMEEVKAGLLDFEGYQDMAGRPDATGIRKRIYLDKAIQSEQIQSTILQAATQMFQMKLAARTPQVTPPAAQNGAVGPDGMPLPPQNGAQPPGFTQMPNGPQQAQQVEQGLGQVPGAGMARTVPNG